MYSDKLHVDIVCYYNVWLLYKPHIGQYWSYLFSTTLQIHGEENLRKQSLHSLGLTGQRAVIRSAQYFC